MNKFRLIHVFSYLNLIYDYIFVDNIILNMRIILAHNFSTVRNQIVSLADKSKLNIP